MPLYFTENYHEVNVQIRFECEEVLFSERSEFQNIEIFQTKYFGKMLVIDDVVMLTERDEFIYHEMISHVPLFVHPNPRRVLIIGGGDGGTVRECLKHTAISHIDLVDIDKMVSQVCLEFLPEIANKLAAEKVRCHFEDGVAFAKNCDEKYDVIIVDSTDPVSVGKGLFTREFYNDCFHILSDEGILVNQSESPAWQPGEVAAISQKLNSIFPNVYFYQAHTPTYLPGHWAFGFASKKYHPVDHFTAECFKNFDFALKYYNAEVHKAAFALPTFFQDLLDK